MDPGTGAVERPIDDVAFLARSTNRVTVLEELRTEPLTRGDLRDRTEMSRATIGRILDGLQDRAWVESEGRTYRLTPFGRLVIAEFDRILEVTEAVQRLREVEASLPLSAMTFDLKRLTDARVTTPSAGDASAHFRREQALLEGADRVRFLCTEAYAPTIEAYRDRVRDQGLGLEAVIAAEALDAATADDRLRPLVMDLVAQEGATLHRYEGSIDVMLGTVDDIGTIVPLDEDGVPAAFIEVEDPEVRAWITETLDDRRADATPVTLESLEP